MPDNITNSNFNPHFKISAAVVKQLGEELITDEVTAFMELVKNSYDADSSRVTIDINTIESSSNENLLPLPILIENASQKSNENLQNLNQPEERKDSKEAVSNIGYISIKDNGIGMSKTDIIDKWMTISLSVKKNAAKLGYQTEKGRTYLGEKGVGRLSTQRLGSYIDLITGIKEEPFYTHLYFNWDDFNENTTLDKVIPGFTTIPKSLNESGTEIIVRKLKNKEIWDGGSYSKIIGQLSQLISPKSNGVNGFKINLKKNNSIQDLLDINKSLDKSFVSSFSFSLKEDVLEISGTVMLRKLYGSSKENHQNFERFLAPDNGKDFFEFLSDVKQNKKEYVSQINYDSSEGKLYNWKLTLKLTEVPELIFVEKRDEDDNLILDENLLLIYELAYPGPFSGKINDYALTKDFGQILNTNSDIKTIIQNQTGIRIYRDGFGIKPYGLNSQDWLKLGSGNTSGSSFYGLKPFNVVGNVQISAKDNYHLREKTDREGFIESPYTTNFFKIMEFIVKQINLTLEKTRRSFNEYVKHISTKNLGINPIQEAFKNLSSTAKNSREVEKRMAAVNMRLEQAKNKIKEVSIDTNNSKQLKEHLTLLNTLLADSNNLVEEISKILDETKKLDNYVDVLQPQIESLENQLSEFTDLASLGLTAEALSHELSNIADKLFEETNSIIKRFAKKIPSELIQLNIYLESVKSSVTSFRKQLSHLDPALKYVRESKETFTLNSLFNELSNYYNEKFKGVIQLQLTNNSPNSRLTVNKGKLIQILDNIVLNSEYWLKEQLKRQKNFTPTIFIDIQQPYIRIYDNGNGIPQAIENTLFQPFVTLKPEGVGRGLGLFIVQQLLDSIGCTITLLPERNTQNNQYIFQLYINSIISS